MANADFNPKQAGTPGGFDAGSYREKASPEQAVNNVWYRCGRPTLFRAMQVTAGGERHERC